MQSERAFAAPSPPLSRATIQSDLAQRFLHGPKVLEIVPTLAQLRAPSLVPHAVRIVAAGAEGGPSHLDAPDMSQDAVYCHSCLQILDDYRLSLAEWFRVLKIGGFLVVSVPHQFLFERKLHPPSRFNPAHKRFYTPASLLMEVEEALDPLEYRLRGLVDDDAGFDDQLSPDAAPTGAADIVLVLERIARPRWADDLRPKLPEAVAHPGFEVITPGAAPPIVLQKVSTPSTGLSILCLKLDHRGDFLLAGRAFRRLRAAFPDANLTLVCGPWNCAAAAELGVFDTVLTHRLFAENPQNPADLDSKADFLKLLQDRVFDVAIDFRIDPESRALLLAANAAFRAGFPSHLPQDSLDLELPLHSGTTRGRPVRQFIPSLRFTSTLGRQCGPFIQFQNLRVLLPSPPIVYGPYIPLQSGIYEVQIFMESVFPHPLTYDIAIDKGQSILAIGEFEAYKGKIGLSAELTLDVTDFEIRIYNNDNYIDDLKFFGVSVFKYSKQSDLHQSELMNLLAVAVEERFAIGRRMEVTA